jgi:hypothetical protein
MQRVTEYEWFARLARTAVIGSQVMADVLWAVISDEEYKIPEILAKHPELTLDGINLVVDNARLAKQDEDGQMELLQIHAAHRFDAGFLVDDISLRASFRSWKAGKGMKLPREEADADQLNCFNYCMA